MSLKTVGTLVIGTKIMSPTRMSLTGIMLPRINYLIRMSSIMKRMKILLQMNISSTSNVSYKSGLRIVQSACRSENS